MKKELTIIQSHTRDYNKRIIIETSELKPATLQELLDAGYDMTDFDLAGDETKEELQETTDVLAVKYHDGNNHKIDIYDPGDDIVIDTIGEIIPLPDPSPAYYFAWKIKLQDGEEIYCTTSNMSGSLSPYYEEDTEGTIDYQE
jgi:hypothetical protein